MKTDVVLKVDEYLDQCCALWKLVSPPAPDARHVPIKPEGGVNLEREPHCCRCDRWGHPYSGCLEPK
jgi:hypothetical protein